MSMSSNDLARARRFVADNGANEQQTITINNAIGGTFTLTWNGQTTVPIPYNSVAATVQLALTNLSNVGLGNVVVNNTNPWLVNFIQGLGFTPQALLSIDGSALTGSGVSFFITEITMGGLTAFSDDELNDNYELASNNFFRAVSYAYRQLQGNAAKFSDYTAGQTSEHKEQVYQHLSDLAQHFEQWSQAQNQAQIVGMKGVPPRNKARPFTQGGFGSFLGGWWGLPPQDWQDSWISGNQGP